VGENRKRRPSRKGGRKKIQLNRWEEAEKKMIGKMGEAKKKSGWKGEESEDQVGTVKKVGKDLVGNKKRRKMIRSGRMSSRQTVYSKPLIGFFAVFCQDCYYNDDSIQHYEQILCFHVSFWLSHLLKIY